MGPNSAAIIRVYTREATGDISDNTLDPGANANVVVDLEAGSATLGGLQWHIGIVVKDLVTGTDIPVTVPPGAAINGNLGTPPWTTQSKTFTYDILAANLTAHKGNLCQVYAYLLVGTNAGNYDASFVESGPFLVLP